MLEAGGEEPLIIDVPAFFTTRRGSNLIWNYKSQPESFVCNNSPDHTCNSIQGKVMGGSSAVNDMYYVRGSKEDYDDWSRLGNEGWSYKEVLPYFLKSEDNRIKSASIYMNWP